jgi:hypothetical protein
MSSPLHSAAYLDAGEAAACEGRTARLAELLPQFQVEDLEILASLDLASLDKIVAMLLGGTFDQATETHRGLTLDELGECWLAISPRLLKLSADNLVRLGWATCDGQRYFPAGSAVTHG